MRASRISWALAIALAALLLFSQGSIAGTTYYVDPALGDDLGAGTEQNPWQTLDHAVAQLVAGDTLLLRGGTYFEKQIRIAAQGTASDPITIQSHPGETATVDGGFQEFRTIGNQDWELFDPVRNIYRSMSVFPGANQAHGYLEINGESTHLVPYEDYGHLSSDNQFRVDLGPTYVGHGLFWDPLDQKIYIRLEPSDLQLFQGFSNPPSLDPRQARLTLFSDGQVLIFDALAAHLVVDGVNVAHQNNALEFETGSHDITVRNAELLGGRTHVLIRDQVHHLLFDGVSVRDSVPPWIAWEDVKVGAEPAHLFQGTGINLQDLTHHIEVRNSWLENIFDGVGADGSSHDLEFVGNTFLGIRDDCFQLPSGGYNHHIHHNQMIRVSKGVSRDGSGSSPFPGTTWVHHNVIDTSELMQYGRKNADGTWHGKAEPGMDGRVWATPFGSHGTDESFGAGDAWKIYHNTIVLGKDISNQGTGIARYRTPGYVTEVYNNIFVQISDHRIMREASAADGMQIYDGNLYYRSVVHPGDALFKNYEPFAGGALEDSATLAEFRRSATFVASRAFYPPGWESHGVESDPRLDAQYRPVSVGRAASGAVPLPAGFPGDVGETFRGAAEPIVVEGLPSIGLAGRAALACLIGWIARPRRRQEI